MKQHHEQMVQLLTDQGGAYRSSELERAYKFHELLRGSEPSFSRHLRDAMLGKERVKAPENDKGVAHDPSCDLGVSFSFAHQTDDGCYVGRAFALCIDGKDLKGNASLELDDKWRLVTNEAWPTRVEHFIRRGRPLGAEAHIKKLENLASQDGISISAEVLEAVFHPIDARLYKMFCVVRGRTPMARG